MYYTCINFFNLFTHCSFECGLALFLSNEFKKNYTYNVYCTVTDLCTVHICTLLTKKSRHQLIIVNLCCGRGTTPRVGRGKKIIKVVVKAKSWRLGEV